MYEKINKLKMELNSKNSQIQSLTHKNEEFEKLVTEPSSAANDDSIEMIAIIKDLRPSLQ